MSPVDNAIWSITPALPDPEFVWNDDERYVSPDEVQRFFLSDRLAVLKERICDIGRRLWAREYTDGNGGNISVRVGHDLVLCSPTLISKGFMKPEDLCLVDLEGRQKAGIRPASSEIKTHLAIMKATEARACVHAHPPHANAFLICGMVPPTGIMPEPDIFFGEVGLAHYATPGSPQNAINVATAAKDHQCVFMQNHGVIVWGRHVEDACWKMENVDAYCRILLLAARLDAPVTRVGADSMRELVNIRLKLGMPDARAHRSDEALFNADAFAGKPFKTL
jgi:L-fuculose-phosphate aldolase